MLRPAISRFVLFAVDGRSPALAQTAADTAGVQGFYREWFGSLPQGPDVYASFYATDGHVLPPNLPPAVGRAAIARWLARAQASSPYTTRFGGLTVDEMRFLDSNWVIHRTTLRGDRTPKAGGDPHPFETKYVDLLHRKPGGGWEVSFRMWSDNQ